MKQINQLINGITMYRLVLYVLAFTAGLSVVFGFAGVLGFSGGNILRSLLIVLVVCTLVQQLLVRVTGAAATVESTLITALILFCMFSPPSTTKQAVSLALTAMVAIASKYLLAWRARHIFNPAAVAAVMVGLLGLTHASWWVANDVLVLFSAIGGALLLQKLHRWQLFLVFFGSASVAIMALSLRDGFAFAQAARDIIIAWPLIFMGTIMLTEPTTLPSTKRPMLVYGLIVGLLTGLHPKIGGVLIAPEIALVIGNIFAYRYVTRRQIKLRYKSKQQLAADQYEYSFEPLEPFSYRPGQYMEVTLPHRGQDSRGNRRVFSIASSPGEPLVRFGIKAAAQPSSFKRRLAALKGNELLYSNRVAGDFILPNNTDTKLLFIAGGIGITPFAGMLRYLIDAGEHRDIVLVHFVRSKGQAAYQDVAQAAGAVGVKTIYVTAKNPQLPELVPDLLERTVYISGPTSLVDEYTQLAKQAGITRNNIRTDYFSGY